MRIGALVPLLALICCLATPALAQKSKSKSEKPKDEETEKTLMEKTSFSGLKFRTLGPALTSGPDRRFRSQPRRP